MKKTYNNEIKKSNIPHIKNIGTLFFLILFLGFFNVNNTNANPLTLTLNATSTDLSNKYYDTNGITGYGNGITYIKNISESDNLATPSWIEYYWDGTNYTSIQGGSGASSMQRMYYSTTTGGFGQGNTTQGGGISCHDYTSPHIIYVSSSNQYIKFYCVNSTHLSLYYQGINPTNNFINIYYPNSSSTFAISNINYFQGSFNTNQYPEFAIRLYDFTTGEYLYNLYTNTTFNNGELTFWDKNLYVPFATSSNKFFVKYGFLDNELNYYNYATTTIEKTIGPLASSTIITLDDVNLTETYSITTASTTEWCESGGINGIVCYMFVPSASSTDKWKNLPTYLIQNIMPFKAIMDIQNSMAQLTNDGSYTGYTITAPYGASFTLSTSTYANILGTTTCNFLKNLTRGALSILFVLGIFEFFNSNLNNKK